MEHAQPETVTAHTTPRRWPLFPVGVLLFLLGPAIYLVQFRLHHLGMPWHLPILASLGVVFMFVSVYRRRGSLRIAGLVLFVAICGLEWWLALVGTRVPPYSGPAQLGQQVPAFTTRRADGQVFSHEDLGNGTRAVLVFYRGRW